MYAWGKKGNFLVFTGVYVCVKAKLTLVSLFPCFFLHLSLIAFFKQAGETLSDITTRKLSLHARVTRAFCNLKPPSHAIPCDKVCYAMWLRGKRSCCQAVLSLHALLALAARAFCLEKLQIQPPYATSSDKVCYAMWKKLVAVLPSSSVSPRIIGSTAVSDQSYFLWSP